MEFITSDLHLMHKKICGKDAFVKTREHFKDEVEMTEYLIKTHNEVVTNNDTVYNLGDLTMAGKPQEIKGLLDRMNGQLVIVKGNHDSQRTLNYLMRNNYKLPNGKDKYVVHDVGFRKKSSGIVYHFTHYPLNVGHLRNNLRSIHGHIHEFASEYPNAINVGIDSPELPVGFKFGEPIPLTAIYEQLEIKVKNAIALQPERVRANPGQLKFDL